MTTFKGQIFDIKRFATHDGNGIRTTVFLKGCPLRCVWCQNPEGLKKSAQILYLESKCIHCGTCIHYTKEQSIEYKDGHLIVQRNPKEDWDTITKMCPTGALCFDSKEYTLQQLYDQIFKDEVFFRNGGGITFSGGEPFGQFEFLLEALKECKKRGIHTAIESSFYTDLKKVEQVLPYVDQIYCDCKLLDCTEHIEYTGVSNERILRNIEYLLTSNKKDNVIIRTPLIPNKTATKENVEKISSFISSIYPDVRYEILNYNPLAKSKYAYLDMEYCFQDNPPLYTSEQMNSFYEIARSHGIQNLIIE